MTTIAVRNGVMAADSMLTVNYSNAGRVIKVHRMLDGCMVGGTGMSGDIAAFRKWWDGGCDGNRPELSDSFVSIILRPTGEVDFCDKRLVPYRVDGDFHAIGSGWEFAVGAMAMGASAEDAVRVACRYDQASSEPIQSERLTA